MSEFSLKKNEILRYKKSIEELFEQRKGFIQFPLRCVYKYTLLTNCIEFKSPDVKVLFVVGKKYHKRAVKRNLIRRRIKEAYRLNKIEFYDNLKKLNVINLNLSILYVGKDETSFKDIEISVTKIFANVVRRIEKDINNNTSVAD